VSPRRLNCLQRGRVHAAPRSARWGSFEKLSRLTTQALCWSFGGIGNFHFLIVLIVNGCKASPFLDNSRYDSNAPELKAWRRKRLMRSRCNEATRFAIVLIAEDTLGRAEWIGSVFGDLCYRRTDNDHSRFLPMGVWTWIVLRKNHNAWIIDLLMRRRMHLSVLPL